MQMSRRISKDELSVILADKECKRDPELSEQFETDVYDFRNEQIIFPKTRVIWDKRTLLERLRVDLEKSKSGPRHCLQGLFQLDGSFPSITKTVIVDGFRLLGSTCCDVSSECVKDFDRQLRRKKHLRSDPVIFAAAIALTGENRIANHTDLRWEMQRHDLVWEPWLATSNELVFPLGLHVYRTLIEGKYGHSLYHGLDCMFFGPRTTQQLVAEVVRIEE